MASQHVRDSQMGHSTATFTAPTHEIGHGASLAALVFGDIGTSPLYTLKECLHAAGGQNAKIPDDLFGILSFMFWALVLVVTVKYLIFVMRADHDGEGGSSRCWQLFQNASERAQPIVVKSPEWLSWP